MRVAPRTTHLPTRWLEPWYLAYALLGLAVAGAVPILLPLLVSRLGSAEDVGLVMAAISLGGLLAPLWGSLADRYRLHRALLTGGLLLTAGGLAALPFAPLRAAWLGLALENEGAGMGLLNATSALAGVFGAALGGWVAARWGYHAALWLAVGGLTLGLCLALTVRPKP
jgi:MFS family permease